MTVITVCPECSAPVLSNSIVVGQVAVFDADGVLWVDLPCGHRMTTAAKSRAERSSALDEMVQLSQELGLYGEPSTDAG